MQLKIVTLTHSQIAAVILVAIFDNSLREVARGHFMRVEIETTTGNEKLTLKDETQWPGMVQRRRRGRRRLAFR